MKRWLIRISKILGGFIGLLLLYVLIAIILSYLPARSSKAPIHLTQPYTSVYVVTNGVHLDFIVPDSLLSNKFREQAPTPVRYSWVGIGWGEAAFFTSTPTWADLTFSTAVNAVLWPSKAALHVSYHPRPRNSWRKIDLTAKQWQVLWEYIEDHAQTDTQGNYIELEGNGYPAHDRFFLATGAYSLAYTCNNWVNEALKKLEAPAAVWSPFDFGVLYHLDKAINEP